MKPSKNIDSNQFLEEQSPFSYREGKDSKVFISYQSKVVKIVKGKPAIQFLNKVKPLAGLAEQLVMAKITGNFKRGNEKDNK